MEFVIIKSHVFVAVGAEPVMPRQKGTDDRKPDGLKECFSGNSAVAVLVENLEVQQARAKL